MVINKILQCLILNSKIQLLVKMSIGVQKMLLTQFLVKMSIGLQKMLERQMLNPLMLHLSLHQLSHLKLLLSLHQLSPPMLMLCHFYLIPPMLLLCHYLRPLMLQKLGIIRLHTSSFLMFISNYIFYYLFVGCTGKKICQRG